MELLEIVKCPKCKGDITLNGDYLTCLQCNTRYPIIEGIPVMRLREEKSRYDDIEYARFFDSRGTSRRLDLSRKALIHKIAELAHIGKSTKVLSVGAGTGLYDQFLACDLVAIDYSVAMLSLASQKGLGKLICADALQLPFQENIFNCVMSFGCSTLSSGESAVVTIREMKRVAQQGGHIIVIFQNKLFNIVKGLLFHANPKYYLDDVVSPQYLTNLFKQQGIEVLHNFTFSNMNPDLKFHKLVNGLLYKTRAKLGPTIPIHGKI